MSKTLASNKVAILLSDSGRAGRVYHELVEVVSEATVLSDEFALPRVYERFDCIVTDAAHILTVPEEQYGKVVFIYMPREAPVQADLLKKIGTIGSKVGFIVPDNGALALLIAVVQRFKKVVEVDDAEPDVTLGGISVFLATGRATLNGEEIYLTKKEAEYVAKRARGDDCSGVNDRAVLFRIRRKFGADVIPKKRKEENGRSVVAQECTAQ